MRGERYWAGPMVLAAGLVMAGLAQGQAITPVAGTEKSWATRNEALNERAKKGDVGMILVGDSLAQGWEDAGKKAWETFYTRRKAVNLGIAGDTAKNILWRLDNGNLAGIAPKLAVVMMGTDYGKDSTSEEIVAGTKAVVEKLREKLPRTKVMVVGVLPKGGQKESRRHADTDPNIELAKLADNKTVFFHNAGFAFVGEDGSTNKELMPDGIHLSAKGYQTLAEWLDDVLGKTMGDTESPLVPVPLSSKDWWFKHHEGLVAKGKELGKAGMIFIGDSITNGWDTHGKKVWAEFYAKRNALNLGVSCDSIQNMLWRLDNGEMDGQTPKLVVIMAGTNNSSRSKVEEIPLGIKALVNDVHTKSPKSKILLLAIFPRGADNNDRWRQVNEKVNAEMAKFADEKKVWFMNINNTLANEDGTIKKELYNTDMLHPVEKGYEVWAEAIEPMVKKLMGE